MLALPIYLIIDEYDNFTNTILSSFGHEKYHKATHGEGFFRFFFNKIKEATTGNNAALERMFITGVSPVTLDDVTSGFNIGANMSMDFRFNGIVGFSETDVREMLMYYKEEGLVPDDVDKLIEIIKPWYDNYCFAEESIGESMYNSDMVLYFLNNYLHSGKAPKLMIDTNIRTDYNKLRHLVRLDKKLGVNFSVIKEIVETGETNGSISPGFPADRLTDVNNFKSLLYYFGMISIDRVEYGRTMLSIPNLTVREQLFTYMIETFGDADIFRLDFNRLEELIWGMSYRGEWQAVFGYIGEELEKQSGIREFIEGEAHVKGFLLAYLGMAAYYNIWPEYEARKGYADFYFQPNFITNPEICYSYLLEVKYANRDASEAKIAGLKEEALEQLQRYAGEPRVAATKGGTQLKLIAVVFKGWEIVAMEETRVDEVC